MTASDIEAELQSGGIDTDGVVAKEEKQTFYAIGFASSDLPETVLGFSAVDDPSLDTS